MLKEITIPLKAKYSTYGELSDKTEKIWFVCHGYGQLSRFFIKKFEILDPKTNFVIAPQGLSKFYLKGFSGRVGATWMTKEDRLTDIENQWTFLESVFDKELQGIDLSNKKIYALGFSQGAATISRWLTFTKNSIDKLIIWSGEVPNEFYQMDRDKIPPIKLVYGKQDPFISFLEIEKQKEDFIKQSITFKVIDFDGKHEVLSEILLLL